MKFKFLLGTESTILINESIPEYPTVHLAILVPVKCLLCNSGHRISAFVNPLSFSVAQNHYHSRCLVMLLAPSLTSKSQLKTT